MGFKPHPKVPSFLLPTIRYGLLLLLSAGCYWHALPGTFVFDDSVAIVKNPDVTAKDTPLGDLFRHDFWGANLTDPSSHKSYRPLTILSFRQEVQAFGLDATRMKTTNFWLHTVIGLLLPSFYRVVGSGGRKFRGEAYLAAVLFVVHPIHTEAVSGIVGRAELLATFWFVVAVLVYGRLIRARDTSPTIPTHLAVLTSVILLTILSVLCKETGITILVTCAALDILTHVNLHTPFASFLRNRLLITRVTTLLAATCTIVYARLWLQDFSRPQFRDKDNPVAVSAGVTRFLSQSYLYALNAWLLLCPDWLSFDWALESIGLVGGLWDVRAWVVGVFYGVVGVLAWRNRARGTVLKGMALTVVPFLPASGLVRVGFVIAERILYIPSLGFCFLVAVGFYRLMNGCRGVSRKVCRVGIVVTCALLAARTHQRSSYWANEHLLFRSALRVVPGNAKVHYNIARLATDEGDRTTAFQFYRQAIELYPEYEAAHMNLGNLYRDEGKYELALKHLKKAIEIHEDFHTAWMNLGIVYAAMKNHAEALVCYQRALQRQKHYPNCVFNLGNLYNDMGNASLALATWNETVRQDPQHIKAWNNMINVYDNANRQQEILVLTHRALGHLPDNPTILSSRATALAKLGRFLDAEQIYAQLVHAHPGVEKYLQNMGVLYHRWGKLDKAERLYRQALALNPNSDMAKNNLAKLLSARRTPRTT
ncbi:hypothetical protein pipiens_009269 [Culex pipiens pipiens]|uniref:dolichyl-phosphate-mannose--protein mannosyltransferase n=1 Tax=Culex pipiens pipiens TaxID=38569 RepID=A0ABD1DED9_CULPP